MIQFFRQNNVLTSFLLIPYTFILRIGFFWLETESVSLPTDGVLYDIFQRAFADSFFLKWFVTNLLISFTAVLLNRLLIKNRLNKDQTLLPGLMFILFASWLEVFIPFSAIHVANYFLILSLLSLFSYSKKMLFTTATFDGALYISLSMLFYTPYILLVVPIILGFFSLDRVRENDVISFAAGLIAPFVMLGGVLYFIQSDMSIFQGFDFGIRFIGKKEILNMPTIIKLVVYLTGFLLCVFTYSAMVKKNNYNVQKKYKIIYWIMIACTIGYIFILNKNSNHLLIFAIPFGVLLGLLWSKNKFRILEEVIHIAIFIGIIFLHISQNFNL